MLKLSLSLDRSIWTIFTSGWDVNYRKEYNNNSFRLRILSNLHWHGLLWDTIPCINMPACEGVQVLLESKWNKNCEGAWRRDLGKETFGLKDKDDV